MKLRTAVVGHGGIGKLHARIARRYGELCAVCDTDASRLAEFDVQMRYTDYIGMLEDARPDVVHICTPHYLHADMVVAALERGVNVLCEKPLCIKEADIARILDAEAASSAQLGVCMQNRYNSANLFAKRLTEEEGCAPRNATGQMIWHRDAAYYASGAWRGRWDTEGGGVLINQALHTLDLLIWFCGEPDTVRASIDNITLGGVIEVEDTAMLSCGGRVPFVFFATNSSACDCPVEISLFVGERGSMLKLLGDRVVFDGKLHSFKEPYEAQGKACYGSGHEALICDFYDCVAEGRRFGIDGREGAKVVRLILKAYAEGKTKLTDK